MMTTPGCSYVRRQVEAAFFAEALYFGAVELAVAPSAELHLYLGIAACGAIGSCADVQRELNGEPSISGGGRPMAGSRSLLLYEGLFHLIEAARAGLRVPDALAPVAHAVLADVEWYLRDDFKTFALTGRKYTAAEAVYGAAAALRRLLRDPSPPSGEVAFRVRGGDELVDTELGLRGGDAAFYDVLARPAQAR